MTKHPEYIKRYRIDKPKHFKLSDYDPADTAGFDIEKNNAKSILARDIERLSDLQEKLYAQDRWALLAIFQGMDAAGKDSAIEHVMSGVNPQGCEVSSFKQPSQDELAHNFLWREARRLPPRGRIGIFNRSYYEEVLAVRVHPELLEKQRLPSELVTKKIWKQRFKDINALERHLTHNGIVVLKFYLHVSKQEQKRRFLERLEEPAKRWKFSMSDVTERALWHRYATAYEDMIRNTSTAHAPWYVVPADNKWFTRLVVAAAMIESLDRLGLEFPKVEGPKLREMKKVRKALLADKALR